MRCAHSLVWTGRATSRKLMAPALRELVASRSNDYSELERRFRALTGGELVCPPCQPGAYGPTRFTRSASVLIGAHNSVRSLVPALVALENCSFNRSHPELLEVIVVDDGSTDETRSVLLTLELDLRWRYVRQSQGGLSAAHNTGLSFAEGDVIVFCDADVVQFPCALEELMKRHQLLDGLTLLGFRFDVDPDDPRLERDRLPDALAHEPPAFWRDFRVSFPGFPSNICRDTRHLQDLGHGRRLWMANGARYNLAAMVVGAFFSIERDHLLATGASDERLVGWGCEDSLIGARSLAFGNAIVPVYSAVGWHVWHPRRDDREHAQFRRNLQVLERICDEPFFARGPDLRECRRRAIEVAEPRRVARSRHEPPYPAPHLDDLARGTAFEVTGRFGEAIAAYEKAGESARSALGRARCLRGQGERNAALTVAHRAVALSPDSGEALLALALALADVGGFAEGRLLLEHRREREHPPFEVSWALEIGANSHKLRGNEHARQALHEIAATDFALALIVDPNCVWAHFDRGLAFRALGRDVEALESMRRADNLLHPRDGNRTWLHSGLAALHARLGSSVVAQAQLERALALYPNNPEALELTSELTG
jgi:tetratricopeptide (TPR) repeat protein/GT2 family glycosyltransferase